MADTVNFTLNLSDDGSINRTTSKVKDLNKELMQAQKLATGTRTGSMAAKAAGYSPGENQEYGVARGAVGTGAEGRDFAKQAQGLGGLVHVYATFAANLFAVGAAFRALSDAADTTNMIKGLDQLSASSGQALGSLAKQLVKTTDGAISLREAMEATTKGGAAGLNSEQMLKMAEVAKKASQALGINMTDAVSRLSRGISKLEPELLDELGIYTKLEKATTDYARSIGKPVSALTDFERRQAFANAVLKEGTEKFGNIKIDANPYDKILSSIKNLAQSGLELVNKVLGPLVSYLSESPTALGAALGLIGVTLLKQAIPAITAMRANIRAAADESAATAQRLAKEAKAAADANLQQTKNIATQKAAVEIKAAQDAIDQIKIKADEALKSRKGTLYNITQMDPSQIGSEQIGKLQSEYQKRVTQGRLDDAEALQKVITQLGIAKDAEQAKAAAIAKAQAEEAKQAGLFNIVRNQQMIAERAAEQAKSRQLVALALENVQTVGLVSAYQLLAASIKKARQEGEIGAVRAAWTQFSGTLAIVTQRLAILANAFSTIGIIAAVGFEAFSLLNDWLSKNKEESKKFTDAMSNLHAAGVLVEDVMKQIDSTGKGLFTVEGILARANAFEELAGSITKGVQALSDVDAKAGTWDKIIDNVKVIFGANLKNTFTKEMALALSKGIAAIPEGTGKEQLKSKLKEILDTGDLSFSGIADAGDKLDSTKIIGVFQQADKAIKGFALSAKEAAKPLKALQDSFVTLETAFGNVTTSLALSDPLSKFGSQLVRVGMDIGKAFQDPVNAFAEMKTLLEDTNKLSLLPGDSIADIMKLSEGIRVADGNIKVYRESLVAAEKALTDLENSAAFSKSDIKQQASQREELKSNIGDLKDKLADSINSLSAYQKEGSKLQVKAMQEGLKMLERTVANAQKSAAISVSQNLLSGVEGEAAAKRRGELTDQELKIQESAILATVTLTDQVLLNRLALDKNTASMDKNLLEAKKSIGTATPEEELKLENIDKLITDLNTVAEVFAKRQKAPDLTTLQPGAASILIQRKETRLAADAAVAPIRAKRQINDLNTELDIENQKFLKKQKQLKLEADSLAIAKSRSDLEQGLLPYLSDQQIQAKNQLEDKVFANNTQQKINELLKVESDLQDKIDAASGKDLEILKAQLEEQMKYGSEVAKNIGRENTLRLDKQKLSIIDNTLAREKIEREERFAKQDQSLRTSAARIDAEQQLLDVKKGLSIITDEDAEKERKRLERAKVFQSYNEQVYKMEETRDTKLADIQGQIDKAKALNKDADVSALQSRYDNTVEFYNKEGELIEKSNSAKMQAVLLDQSLSDKMKGFSDIVKNAFESMADALVEFVKTGKLNFSDLINQMLADLLRFELRAQFSALYASMGGLSGMLSGLGFGGGVTPPAATAGPYLTAAKGGAWDYGIQKFAAGGMFTNSVVDSPTLFKFASGTGLMGEAGPEAIMPLTRDGSGNLGVRTQGSQGKVDVIVNNFGKEQATTTESTDSRGNRRIEVTIGDMTAGEISRSGSSSQRSIRNTFGLQPQLIRR